MADFLIEGGLPVAPRTAAERAAARRTLAGYATDAADLRYLLDATGLWPAGDGDAAALTPTPSWDCGGGMSRPRH